MSSEAEKKLVEIGQACTNNDLTRLRELAISPGGFVIDDVRRKAWPLLLGSDVTNLGERSIEWKNLAKHVDEDQVKLDVNRSFVFYPHEPDKQIESRKEELHELILEVLRRHPFLSYFQGYHDILQVLLLVLGPTNAVAAAERLSLLRIRDYMLPTIAGATIQLRLIPCILRAKDPALERHLSVTQPFFALSATLTLYAHEIEEYGAISRLFDFLLATEAVTSLYIFAAIILARRKELIEIEADEPEMLHATLSKLPRPLDLDALISSAMELYRRHPPSSLKGREWRGISRYSVLKTTLEPQSVSKQSLAYGETLFKKHAAELRRMQTLHELQTTLWYYRRPASTIGLTLTVAVFAIWVQRRGGMPSEWHSITQYLSYLATRIWS